MNVPTVLILGAGATRAETDWHRNEGLPQLPQAPLDSDCLKALYERDSTLVRAIQDDLFIPTDDYYRWMGMEQVFSDLFSEVLSDERSSSQDPNWGSTPPDILFARLIRAYQGLLADATGYESHPKFPGPMWEMIKKLFSDSSGQLTIVTFNHDLLVERAVSQLRTAGTIGEGWGLPPAYALDFVPDDGGSSDEQSGDELPRSASSDCSPAILKLHGSFNWYVPCDSATPDFAALAESNQAVFLDQSTRIMSPSAANEQRWPLIVPPVFNKSPWIEQTLSGVWQRAEVAVGEAKHVAFWGYSLPDADYRAQHLIRRGVRLGTRRPRISIVDPEVRTVERVRRALAPSALRWFQDHDAFLSD